MDLEICKLSHCSASVAGGTEIILLCKRIDKDDIEVRFFEFRHGQLYWEATGEFSSANVHEQVGNRCVQLIVCFFFRFDCV